MLTKSTETLKKVFSNAKYGIKKDLPALPPQQFFHVYIINKQSYDVYSH